MIKCDFCECESSEQTYKCFGCEKSLCAIHTIYHTLYTGNPVYLCVDCHSSFLWTNLEALKMIFDAHRRADELMSVWKASCKSQSLLTTRGGDGIEIWP